MTRARHSPHHLKSDIISGSFHYMYRMDESKVTKQLAELQLIKCSLLPNEIMQFIDDYESLWSRLLDEYETTMTLSELPALKGAQIPALKFRVKADSLVKVWFEVEMPLHGNDDSTAVVYVKGDYLSRAEQDRWENVIHEKQREVGSAE